MIMKKRNTFFRGSLLFLPAALFFLLGCPHDNTVRRGGDSDYLAAPANLRASEADGQITVQWDAVTNAKEYEVSWSPGEGQDNPAITEETVYVIKGLTNGTAYTVSVRAGDGSDWGKVASVTATPEVPSTVIAGAPREVPTLAGFAAYEVGGSSTVSNTVIQEWYGQTESNNDYPAGKDKGLLSGVIMTQWKPVEGATSYEVFVATGENSPQPDEAVAAVTRTSYFHRDCEPGITYRIWVRAVNDAGAGSPSLPYNSVVPTGNGIQTTASSTGMVERADYPKNLVTTVTGEGSVSLSWDKSDRAVWYEVYYHNADITINYNLIGEGWAEGLRRLVPYKKINELQNAATPWNDYENTAGAVGEVHKIHSCSTVVTGLDPAEQYYFWVRSLNHNGERGLAKSAFIRPSLAGGLPAPTGVQVNPVSPGGGGMLKVDWNEVTGADGYRVYYSKYSVPSLSLLYVNVSGGATTTVTINRLDENNLYYIWVVAYKGTGAAAVTSPFSQAANGVPNFRDGTEPVLVTKTAVWGQTLKNLVYVEVNNNDPRAALGYILENSGEQFFDAVIIFAANLRVRNCATASAADKATHRCTRNGPHIHYNGNVQHIFDNRDKYIKPLQDAGIKVLMGTLPDHDNFTYHSLGSWPFESGYPWATADNPGSVFHSSWYSGDPAVYPLGPSVRAAFVEELCSEIERLGLDGFDIDDEWASDGSTRGLSVRPGAYPWSDTSNNAIAKNIAEFLYLCRVRLGPEKIISVYDYGAPGSYLGTSGAMMEISNGEGGTREIEINPNIWDYITVSSYSMYGGVKTGTLAGGPRMGYSPYAIGFHNMTGASDANTYTNAATAGDPYGWMLFYDLGSHAYRNSATSQLNLINRYAPTVYGQNVIYSGPDYPQDWAKW
jgi:hypothetical protein